MDNFTAPEGFELDPGSGRYHHEIIETDENGNSSMVISWFDPETGRLDRRAIPVANAPAPKTEPVPAPEPQPAPEQPAMAEPVYAQPEDDLDDDFDVDDYVKAERTNKKSPLPLILGISFAVIVITLLTLGYFVFGWFDGLFGKDKDDELKGDTEIEAEYENESQAEIKPVAESRRDGDNQITGLTTPRSFDELYRTDSWIVCNGISPFEADYDRVSMEIAALDAHNASRITVRGIGDMTGQFLINPKGYSEQELYVFEIDMPYSTLYLVGMGEGGTEPKFVDASYFDAYLFYRDNGEDRKIPVEFSAGDDGITFYNVSIPDVGALDFTTIEEKAFAFGIRAHLADYGPAGSPVITVFDGNNEPEYSENGSQSAADAAASVTADDFTYFGVFTCTEDYGEYTPYIFLKSDGTFEFYANMAEFTTMMYGTYTYQAEGSGLYNIHLAFEGNSPELSQADLQYGTEGEMLSFLTPGFGLMGGDDYNAGYFSKYGY